MCVKKCESIFAQMRCEKHYDVLYQPKNLISELTAMGCYLFGLKMVEATKLPTMAIDGPNELFIRIGRIFGQNDSSD